MSLFIRTRYPKTIITVPGSDSCQSKNQFDILLIFLCVFFAISQEETAKNDMKDNISILVVIYALIMETKKQSMDII